MAFLGYLMGAIAPLSFALLSPMGILGIYPAAFLLGVAVAATETFEPTIISRLTLEREMGAGMGLLSFSRGVGIFLGNAIMGVLYQFHYSYTYYYASASSLIASLMVQLLLRAGGRSGRVMRIMKGVLGTYFNDYSLTTCLA